MVECKLLLTWRADKIFVDNDFADAETFECVVYYVAGYLAKRVSKKTSCNACLSGIKNIDNHSNTQAAKLLNLKSRGYLTHPDSNFFMLLKLIEKCFVKHKDSQNVFDDTVEEFFNNNYLVPFPCAIHKEDMVEFIFTSYIAMRMRQYAYMTNHKTKSTNKVKKKIAKLVSK
ncbi:uncharacterized protein LOC111031433 [Myzus persicae]|uniref:uncharacterized protein LOC111031433 n=1 Tax=Myzus persicae TaxID=13164 RepID=UPI000B930E91|nr:uncharacterized protein LOC111031433 [Myzus persicae]